MILVKVVIWTSAETALNDWRRFIHASQNRFQVLGLQTCCCQHHAQHEQRYFHCGGRGQLLGLVGVGDEAFDFLGGFIADGFYARNMPGLSRCADELAVGRGVHAHSRAHVSSKSVAIKTRFDPGWDDIKMMLEALGWSRNQSRGVAKINIRIKPQLRHIAMTRARSPRKSTAGPNSGKACCLLLFDPPPTSNFSIRAHFSEANICASRQAPGLESPGRKGLQK